MLGFLLLVISWVWKAGGISSKTCFLYRRIVRYPVQYAFESLLTATAKRCAPTRSGRSITPLLWLIAYRLVLAVWVPYFAVFEFLASFASVVWISALGLVFGTIQIAVPRQQNQVLVGANEDVWGFGQLVPLILLIQPLSAVWEVLVVDANHIREEQLYRTEPSDDEQQDQSSTSKQVTEHSETKPSSLLHYLAAYQPVKSAERETITKTTVEQILLDSRVFYVNVYLIQPAIITASVFAFWNDALSIGYETSSNWSNFCIVLSAYVGVAWTVTFCLAPWDIIGRKPREWQAGHDEAYEQVEEGSYIAD